MPLISSKRSLAVVASSLKLDFVPPFLDETGAMDQERTIEAPFSWLSKSFTHRNVTVLPSIPAHDTLSALFSQGLIQRRVTDPLLVDGTMGDIGVYALTVDLGDSTWAFSIFDDALLRF